MRRRLSDLPITAATFLAVLLVFGVFAFFGVLALTYTDADDLSAVAQMLTPWFLIVGFWTSLGCACAAATLANLTPFGKARTSILQAVRHIAVVALLGCMGWLAGLWVGVLTATWAQSSFTGTAEALPSDFALEYALGWGVALAVTGLAIGLVMMVLVERGTCGRTGNQRDARRSA